MMASSPPLPPLPPRSLSSTSSSSSPSQSSPSSLPTLQRKLSSAGKQLLNEALSVGEVSANGIMNMELPAPPLPPPSSSSSSNLNYSYNPNAERKPMKAKIRPPTTSIASSSSAAAAVTTASKSKSIARGPTIIGDRLSDLGINEVELSDMPDGPPRNPVDPLFIVPEPSKTTSGLNYISLRLWRGGIPKDPKKGVDHLIKDGSFASHSSASARSPSLSAKGGENAKNGGKLPGWRLSIGSTGSRGSGTSAASWVDFSDDIDTETAYALYNRDWACVVSVGLISSKSSILQSRHRGISFHTGDSALFDMDLIGRLIPKRSYPLGGLRHYVLERTLDEGKVYFFVKEKIRGHSVFFIYEGSAHLNKDPEKCRYMLHWNKNGRALLRSRSSYVSISSPTVRRHTVIGKNNLDKANEDDEHPRRGTSSSSSKKNGVITYPDPRLFDITIADFLNVQQPSKIRVSTGVDVILALAAFIIADRYMVKANPKLLRMTDDQAKQFIINNHFSGGIGQGDVTDLLY